MTERSKVEPFVLLSRSTKGQASAKVVADATGSPGVYAFAELLALPSIQALAQDPQLAAHYTLLELFAYGTLAEYEQARDTFPPLSANQLAKLRLLTLVSLALQSRSLTYPHLLDALQLDSVRALEDTIIDAIYAGLLGGKIHHHEQILHINWVAGRDVRDNDMADVKQNIDIWCANAADLLSALDAEIARTRQAVADTMADIQQYSEARDAAYLSVLSDLEVKQSKRVGTGGGSGGPDGPKSRKTEKAMSMSGGQGGGKLGAGRMNLARSAEHGSDRASKRARD